MKVVQQLLIDKLIAYMDIIMTDAKVRLNGTFEDYKVFKTYINENSIRKYIYLDVEEGLVEEAQLISNTGEVLAIKPYSIQKANDGLMLAFEFRIKVEEVLRGA